MFKFNLTKEIKYLEIKRERNVERWYQKMVNFFLFFRFVMS